MLRFTIFVLTGVATYSLELSVGTPTLAKSVDVDMSLNCCFTQTSGCSVTNESLFVRTLWFWAMIPLVEVLLFVVSSYKGFLDSIRLVMVPLSIFKIDMSLCFIFFISVSRIWLWFFNRLISFSLVYIVSLIIFLVSRPSCGSRSDWADTSNSLTLLLCCKFLDISSIKLLIYSNNL